MPQKKLPTARNFMNSDIFTLTPDHTLAEVVKFLLKHEISNAPVVEQQENGSRNLVGFISEQDCLEYLSNEMFFGSPAQVQTARTMMKRHPVCIEPDTDIFTLASIFVTHGYRHLPVVEDQHLHGIVSRRDILKALNDYYQEYIQQRDFEHFPPDLHEIIHHRFLMQGR